MMSPGPEAMRQHERHVQAMRGLRMMPRGELPAGLARIRYRRLQRSAERDWMLVSSHPVPELPAAVSTDPEVDAIAHPFRWKAIAKEVCLKHQVGLNELLSIRRPARVVAARQELSYRLYTETSLSMPAIGRLLLRDHTTILHGIRKHAERAGVELPAGVDKRRAGE